ncbi:heme-dependent oxidative N-demethylase family protein [Roseivivax sp.]
MSVRQDGQNAARRETGAPFAFEEGPPVLQRHLPYDPGAGARLPGTRPLGEAPWLIADEAYAGQMALRDRLLADCPEVVLALDPGARPAAQELLEEVLAELPAGFAQAGDQVTRPDGVSIAIDPARPMETLCRLVQEDLCILEKPEGAEEHVLTAAALCFPARWRLSEKFMRPLVAIHAPVPEYDEGVARRVQRMFDGLRPGLPIWRFNVLWHDDPTLHQPGPPAARPKWAPERAAYLRTERQVLRRLPKTRAVIFSIHTYMLAAEDVPEGPGSAADDVQKRVE